MSKQKKVLLASITAVFLMIFTQNQVWSGEKLVRLKANDTIPDLTMEDIKKKEVKSSDYSDRIVIFSFGDRASNKPLQAAIGPAAKKVVMSYPKEKIAYINFADVVIVPNMMKYVVNPILNYINESNTKEMKKQYADEGLPWNENLTTFVLIPEWDGDYLKAFGLESAKEWSVFVTYKNKIYGVCDGKTKDFQKEFFIAFKTIVDEKKKDEKKEKK